MFINNKKQEAEPLANPWMIFLVTALGVGMSSIDGGIVNVALPTFSHQYHITVSTVQWIVSSYILMICVTLPLFGYLSDLVTKRRIYLLGLFIFTLSSALCGFAFSFLSLVIFRFLQGLGAAMIFANNQAIIMTSFPQGKQGQALGVNAMIFAVGSIAGPGIGGFLIGLGDWRSIFFINIPLGILGCIMGYKLLPRDQVKKISEFDIQGAVYFAIMMTAFILMLSNGIDWGLFSLKTMLVFLTTIITGILFFLSENKVSHPMVDFNLFKIWVYLSGNIVSFFMLAALSANLILLPFYLESQQLLSPNMMGLILLVAPVFIGIFAPISGFLTEKINLTILISAGLGIAFIGLVSQSFLTAHSSLWMVIIDQSLMGVGVGLFTSPNNYSMLSNVPQYKMGIATSINSLTRNVAKIVGTVLATSIFTVVRLAFESGSTSSSFGFEMGFRAALITAAVLLLIGMVISVKRYKVLE